MKRMASSKWITAICFILVTIVTITKCQMAMNRPIIMPQMNPNPMAQMNTNPMAASFMAGNSQLQQQLLAQQQQNLQMSKLASQSASFSQGRRDTQSPTCRLNVPGCGIRASGVPPIDLEPSLKYASVNEVPWQAAIRVQVSANSKPWFCSGIIINEEWVVCPAYCLYHKVPGDLSTRSITLAAGISNAFDNKTMYTKITSYSIHASYTGSKSKGFDIALMKSAVQFPLSINGPINAICLPETEELDFGPGKTSGWPGFIMNQLVITTSTTGPIERCVGIGTLDIADKELCSISSSPPDCNLDVGSGFWRQANPQNPNSPFFLIGVLSKKVTCRRSFNSVSTVRLTRMSFFHNWIAETTQACRAPDGSRRDRPVSDVGNTNNL